MTNSCSSVLYRLYDPFYDLPVWLQVLVQQGPWQTACCLCDTYSSTSPMTHPRPLREQGVSLSCQVMAYWIQHVERNVAGLQTVACILTLLLRVQVALNDWLAVHFTNLGWMRHSLHQLLYLLTSALKVVPRLQTTSQHTQTHGHVRWLLGSPMTASWSPN